MRSTQMWALRLYLWSFHSVPYQNPLHFEWIFCLWMSWQHRAFFKNFGSLNYAYLPNFNTFHYIIQKVTLINTTTCLIRKRLNIITLSNSHCGYNFSKILIFLLESKVEFCLWQQVLSTIFLGVTVHLIHFWENSCKHPSE